MPSTRSRDWEVQSAPATVAHAGDTGAALHRKSSPGAAPPWSPSAIVSAASRLNWLSLDRSRSNGVRPASACREFNARAAIFRWPPHDGSPPSAQPPTLIHQEEHMPASPGQRQTINGMRR